MNKQQTDLTAIMETIQAGLPVSFATTNKKPVQKEIRPLTSLETEILWTSWCTDIRDNRYLAVLQSNGRVKLISQENLSNYKLRSVR